MARTRSGQAREDVEEENVEEEDEDEDEDEGQEEKRKKDCAKNNTRREKKTRWAIQTISRQGMRKRQPIGGRIERQTRGMAAGPMGYK